MERPTCADCAYWGRNLRPDMLGECRRGAPSAIEAEDVADEIAAWWPLTADDDWCGGHHLFPAYLRSLESGPPSGDDGS